MGAGGERRLVVVHAHPDDECITTGGTLARYATSGAHVCLVTCTNGELGEIATLPGMPPATELRPRLGAVRAAELSAACDALGVRDVRLLGYHDSGMAGTDTNRAPHAFMNTDVDSVAARIAAVLDEVRPQVVVTYDASGLYGHPDHVHAHRATVRALERRPAQRLFYAVVSRGHLREVGAMMATTEGTIFSDDNVADVATDDERITVRLDVRPYLSRKIEALRAHRTQWGTTRDFLELADDVRDAFLGREFFELDAGRSASSPVADDLFDGIDA